MYTIKTSFVVLFVITTSIFVGLSFRPSSKVNVDTMRAVVTVADGKIELKEVPIPTPEFGEVLVKVAYAPINPSDVYHALRDYAVPGVTKTFPYMNGLEGSGVVVGHGGGVLPMIYAEMGSRVSFAIGTGGSWAEYVSVPAMTVVPLPEDVDLKSGSAATVNPLTVIGFLEVAREGNHKTIVHTAANSALGLMLLRAAETHDLTIVCVVRGEKNQNILVKDLNYPAELVVRSDLPNFEEELQKVVKKTKATLAFDAVGGEMSQKIYDAMPKKSQTFSYGLLSGEYPPKSLLENKNSAKSFDGFHLKNWLDEGGLPRLATVAMKGRSMLANELKTEFQQVLEFDNDILAKIEEYNRHQKGGKMVMKVA